VVRASTDAGRYPVLDTYVYATTSPIYVTVAGRKQLSTEHSKWERFSEAIARILRPAPSEDA